MWTMKHSKSTTNAIAMCKRNDPNFERNKFRWIELLTFFYLMTCPGFLAHEFAMCKKIPF